jgi:predicted esterase
MVQEGTKRKKKARMMDFQDINTMGMTAGTGAHGNQPIYHAGTPLAEAKAVVVLLHGRGASAADILTLVPHLATAGVAFVAPQAAGHTWYPYSFLASRAQNEPFLSSALTTVDDVVEQMKENEFAVEKIVVGGFSQGACLASEYVARHPVRYGGLIAFSGGLIGPLDEPLDHSGDLAQTPVFLGCSDIDPHIPLARVDETAAVLTAMQAQVTKQIYPGMAHTINEDEVEIAHALIAELV